MCSGHYPLSRTLTCTVPAIKSG